ncbi:hypothetical protein QKW52_10250 [Bacillus sonorensis]|nr:hypothetical protein [Bacillus sonorensis]
MNQFDNDLESEYALSETEESFVLGLYGALTQATQKEKKRLPSTLTPRLIIAATSTSSKMKWKRGRPNT